MCEILQWNADSSSVRRTEYDGLGKPPSNFVTERDVPEFGMSKRICLAPTWRPGEPCLVPCPPGHTFGRFRLPGVECCEAIPERGQVMMQSRRSDHHPAAQLLERHSSTLG